MQRAPSFVTYEMDQLGQAFNRMVHRLAAQRLTLDKLNRQLEITINTRTRQLAVRNRELLTLNRISNIALAAHSMPEAYQAIVREVSADLEHYDIYQPTKRIEVFVEQLSNWYVRRFWTAGNCSTA